MALVSDQSNPTSAGMFSKAGRFTTEKYIIFQRKEEILNNKRKFLKVTALPHLKMDFESKEFQKGNRDDEETKPKSMSPMKSRKEASPFSQQLSREDYYEVKGVKHPPPPCGFYNPKFEQVERTEKLLFKYDMEKKKMKFSSTMRDFDPQEASRPIPDKLQSYKVAGPVPFQLQTVRESVAGKGNNPHEERFTYLEFPKNFSKVRKPLHVDMKKTLPRDDKLMFKNIEHAPDYSPNHEFLRKSLGSCGVSFEKHTPRKNLHHVSPSSNENFLDHAKVANMLFSRSQEVFFNRTRGRDSDSSSPLPSFMQKTINNRSSIGTMSQKTMEINNFSDGKFQTVHSGFFPAGSLSARFK